MSRSKLDPLLWILALVLIGTGVLLNYYFMEVLWSLRFTLWIVLVGVVSWLVVLTAHGKKFLTFIKEAKVEIYKVVWPTRDETVKITLVVAALVLVMSTTLWAVDSVLLWVVSWFTKL